MIGRIKVWRHEKGYGFCSTDTPGKDVFAHIRQMVGIPHPDVGMWVHFDLSTNPRNAKEEATNIKPLPKQQAEEEQAWASQHRPVRMGDEI